MCGELVLKQHWSMFYAAEPRSKMQVSDNLESSNMRSPIILSGDLHL